MKHLPKRPHVKPIPINHLRIAQIIVGILTAIITISCLTLIPNRNSFPPDPYPPKYFDLPVYKNDKKVNLTVDAYKIVLAVHLIPDNQCIYSHDRLNFIIPLINKLIQYAHVFKLQVIQFTYPREVKSIDTQRIRGFKAIQGGLRVNTYEKYANKKKTSKIYSEVAGKCMYLDLNKPTKAEIMPDIHPQLARFVRDAFITEKNDFANAVYGLGGKYVLIAGNNLDYDLMQLVDNLVQSNLVPIILSDLVDSNYVYELQKDKYKTHTDFIKAKLHELSQREAYYLTHTEFINALRQARLKNYVVGYLNPDSQIRLFKTV